MEINFVYVSRNLDIGFLPILKTALINAWNVSESQISKLCM